MRYIRIFLLHFQDVLHSRSRALVWFLVAFIAPLLLLLFWQGAIREHGEIYGSWNSSTITSYYLLLAIATSLLVVHIEEDVAFRDIKEGGLVKYLLRPFPYFLIKCMEELPWRITQGSFGVIIFIFFRFIIGIQLPIVQGIIEILLAITIVVLAMAVSYALKMVVGLMAFWTTDFWGMIALLDFLFAIFGGIVAPLVLYPSPVANIAMVLPFSYILYFPVIAIEGLLSTSESLRIIGTQCTWLFIFCVAYQFIWKKGVKEFTAIGQ